MGRALVRAIQADESLTLVGAIEHADHEDLGQDVHRRFGVPGEGPALTADLGEGLEKAQVVIDFSLPPASQALLERAAELRIPAVVGTTGGDASWESALRALADVSGVVFAPNFSQGVTVMEELARIATRLLGPAFDAEIVEMHHGAKVDAPSGTALHLAKAVCAEKGLGEGAIVHGRSGEVGRRPADEVAILSLRGGDVVGDHTLVLAGPAERIEITHRAHSRDVFALGALRSAKWVLHQPAGLYGLGEVLSG